MKVKNELAKAEFLELAKADFLKMGYRKVTLRDIAKKADKTTGFIYTYFKNKNDIYEQLVGGLIAKFEAKLADKHPSFDDMGKTGINLKGWVTNYMRFLMDLAENHPDEMDLLFLKSEGSRFATFKQEVIEKGVQRSNTEFRKLNRTKEFEGQEISVFFTRNLVNYVFNTALEVVKNRSSKEEIEQYEAEITAFIYHGWKGLVDF